MEGGGEEGITGQINKCVIGRRMGKLDTHSYSSRQLFKIQLKSMSNILIFVRQFISLDSNKKFIELGRQTVSRGIIASEGRRGKESSCSILLDSGI